MRSAKDRLIIDTNLWVSFLISRNYTGLDAALTEPSVMLLFSEALLQEFISVAGRSKFEKYFSPAQLQALLLWLHTRATFINVFSEVDICRDSKDNFLLSLAQDGGATYLLTGDNDLLSIGTFGQTQIMTIAAYLSLQQL